jgi:hypothetical protein
LIRRHIRRKQESFILCRCGDCRFSGAISAVMFSGDPALSFISMNISKLLAQGIVD